MTEEIVPEVAAKTFALDLDIENYTVAEERAAHIRGELAEIRSKSWLSSLFDWVQAEGQDDLSVEGALLESTPGKRLAWEQGHSLGILELSCDGTELDLRLRGSRFLTLQRLPKGEELLITNYNPDLAQDYASLEPVLHNCVKDYLKTKTEKMKAFQERFKKAEKT